MAANRTLRIAIIVWALAATLGSCAFTPDDQDSDLYYGFTLIDPERETVTPDAFIVVAGGKLVAVGAGDPPAGKFRSTRDLRGRFGMPGLVDAHAHITAGPHKVELVNGTPAVTIESVDEITQFNGKMALAFGVTTVRNPAGDPEANARYDQQVRLGAWIGPDAVHAGAAVQPPPFAGAAFTYPQTEAEWKAEAKRQADLGMKYFKLYVSLTAEELSTGIRVAHEYGLRAIAHLDRVSWTRALQLGVDDLTHALPTSAELLPQSVRKQYLASLGKDSTFMYRWFELVDLEGPEIGELIDELAKRQVRVDLTLLVNELVYNVDDLERIVPARIRRYSHSAVREAGDRQLKASAKGWTPDDFTRARAVMPTVLRFAKRLHDAGVPLLIGTDGHGGTPLYARELQLRLDAGIAVWDVLRLSTSQGAQRLGLGGVTGRIEPGYDADLVFLNNDPLSDVRNITDVHTVVTNGRAFSFEELTASVAAQ
jgi:imidazolonepropionase-like amidohydrolase